MKFSAQAVSRLLVSATVVVLIILSYVSYIRIKELIRASNLVNRTNLIRLELQKCYSYLKNAEAGHRGYLLTHDSAFLTPYNASFTLLEGSLAALDTMLRDNPKQVAHLDTLRNLIGERLIIMAKILDADNSSPLGNSRQKTDLFLGKSKMNVIGGQMDLMVSEETKLLSIRETAMIEQQSLAPLLTFMVAVFSLLVVLYAFFKINKELTIKIRMQKELEVKNSILQQTNKELEHFAFGASHDLQEPLRKIETFISMLQTRKTVTSSPEEVRLMDKIQNSVVRMRSLVNDLLNYAHFFYTNEENKPVYLNNVIQDVLLDSQTLIDEKHALFEIGELPVIHGIQPQLYRLFQNLIGNAMKYAKPGTIPVIKIYSERAGEDEIKGVTDNGRLLYRITVEDNGVGFEDKYKEKIFEMFQRLHNKNQFSGSGIGLSICRKVVHNHGGHITASSILNEGAKFQVYLPAYVNHKQKITKATLELQTAS